MGRLRAGRAEDVGALGPEGNPPGTGGEGGWGKAL